MNNINGSCSSSSIQTLPPYITQGEKPRHALFAEREELRQELEGIRAVLSLPLPQDDLTVQIRAWYKDLSTAFAERNIDEEELNAYIEDMQEILRDPLSSAPLGLYPVLGNDGYVYGQLSLEIHRITVCVERQYTRQEGRENRSPVEPDPEVRFATGPHIVGHHMILWLQKHHALLMSEALEEAYLRFAPQHRQLPIEQRVALLVAESEALDRAEIEQRNRRTKALERTLTELSEENRQDFAALTGLARTIQDPLQSVQEEINAMHRGAQREIDRVSARVEQFMPRIEAFAKATIAQLQQTGNRDKVLIERLEQLAANLDGEIADLTQKHEELKQSLEKAEKAADELKLKELKLKEEIARKKKERAKRRKKRIKKIVKIVACVVVSLTAAYLAQYYLPELGVSVMPANNGSTQFKASFELVKF